MIWYVVGSVAIRGRLDGFVFYVLGAIGDVCRLGTWRRVLGGAKKEGRTPILSRKWRLLFVKRNIYRPVGSVATRGRCGGFVFYVYLVRLGLYVGSVHGGGRWVGAEKEGWRPRLSQNWRILVIKSNIYRPDGVRSAPRACRRFRILCLFGTCGVLWR